MLEPYNLLKFVHLVSITVWLGGLYSLNVVNMRFARTRQPEVVEALLSQGNFIALVIFTPASLLTLLSGTILVTTLGLSFKTLWVAWGLGGVLVTFLIGIGLIRPTAVQLAREGAMSAPDEQRMNALRRRMRWYGALNLIVLLSIVWVSVAKPG
jgi:uncharacterized membrane protein